MSELVARLKALLRRPGGALSNLLELGNVAFDTVHRDVRVGDKRMALSRSELTLLELLRAPRWPRCPASRAGGGASTALTISSGPIRLRRICRVCAASSRARGRRCGLTPCAGWATCCASRAHERLAPGAACLAPGDRLCRRHPGNGAGALHSPARHRCRHPERYPDRALDRIATSLSRGPDGSPRLMLDQDDGSFDYAVAAPDGRMLLASANPPPAAPPGWQSGFLSRVELGTTRVLGYGHADTALGPVEIRIAMDRGKVAPGIGPLLRELRDEMIPVLLPALLAALAIGALTLHWGLRPLQKIASEAARITANESERRLPVEGLPRELAPPVHAINAALDRLDRGFRAQRDFTADAAHQLRTPLAILAAHLDTLGDQAAAASLRQDVARMSRLVDQMLLVAELEALTLKPEERTDLAALGVEVVEAVAPWRSPAGAAWRSRVPSGRSSCTATTTRCITPCVIWWRTQSAIRPRIRPSKSRSTMRRRA